MITPKVYLYTLIVAFSDGTFQQTQVKATKTQEALMIYSNTGRFYSDIVSVTFAEKKEIKKSWEQLATEAEAKAKNLDNKYKSEHVHE